MLKAKMNNVKRSQNENKFGFGLNNIHNISSRWLGHVINESQSKEEFIEETNENQGASLKRIETLIHHYHRLVVDKMMIEKKDSDTIPEKKGGHKFTQCQ